MKPTMLWTFIFCIQAAFTLDQSILDSFKTVKEKFLQAQDAFGQFEKLLQQDTSSGLEEEYRILHTMNAWNRMSTWTRPKTSSNRSTKEASEEVEKVDRKQPNSLQNIKIGKTTVKIYKDTKNNTMILSMKTRTDAEFSHLQLMAKAYSTYIKLLPGMCGKGLCFMVEKRGADCLVVFIADMTLVSQFIEMSIHLSHSDSFVLRAGGISTQSNDTLLTYYFQEFQVQNEEDYRVILDPQVDHMNLRTAIILSETKDANFSDIQPYTFYEPGTHNVPHFEYNGYDDDYTIQDGIYQAAVRYELNPDQPLDGVINFGQQIQVADDIYLEIRKRYTVFPKGQEDSIYFSKGAIVGNAHEQGSLQAYLPHAFNIGVFGAPTDISIRKHSKNKISNSFPGFDFLITRYAKGIMGVAMTSYNLTLEDTGTYEIMAYFADGMFTKYSFNISVVKEKINIESFSKFGLVGDKNDEMSLEVTCTATGNPWPTVNFVNVDNDNSSYAIRENELENNATFEIFPSESSEKTESKKMIVHKLPESFVYPYQIGCKIMSGSQEYMEILYIYESDFGMY